MSASLSIVIPAYNEAIRLGNTLTAVVKYLRESWPGRGSDRRRRRLNRRHCRHRARHVQGRGSLRTSVISYKSNLGKGRAVRLGLLAARSDIALFSDADLSTPITEAPKLVEPIMNGQCDVTFGSRALDRKLIGVHQPWRREQGGRVFNLAVRLATGCRSGTRSVGSKRFA